MGRSICQATTPRTTMKCLLVCATLLCAASLANEGLHDGSNADIVPDSEDAALEMLSTGGHADWSRLDTKFDQQPTFLQPNAAIAPRMIVPPAAPPNQQLAVAAPLPKATSSEVAKYATATRSPSAVKPEISAQKAIPKKRSKSEKKASKKAMKAAMKGRGITPMMYKRIKELRKNAKKNMFGARRRKAINELRAKGPFASRWVAIWNEEKKNPKLRDEIKIAQLDQMDRVIGVEGNANVRSLEQEDGNGGPLENEVQEERSEANDLVGGGMKGDDGFERPAKNLPSYEQYMHQQFNNNARFMRPGMGGMGGQGGYNYGPRSLPPVQDRSLPI